MTLESAHSVNSSASSMHFFFSRLPTQKFANKLKNSVFFSQSEFPSHYRPSQPSVSFQEKAYVFYRPVVGVKTNPFYILPKGENALRVLQGGGEGVKCKIKNRFDDLRFTPPPPPYTQVKQTTAATKWTKPCVVSF